MKILEKLKMNRKGQLEGITAVLGSLLAIGLTYVALSIGLSFGAKVNSDISADLTGVPKAIADNGTEALNTIGKYQPTTALVAVAAVIMAMIFSAFLYLKVR